MRKAPVAIGRGFCLTKGEFMAKSLGDLANSLRKMGAQISEQSNALSIEVAETMLADLTVKTPVDTTKAISNWQVSLNKPAEGILDPYYPGKQGSTWSESAQETYEQGKKVLLNKKPGDSIHITNNAPHIVPLNNGHSEQAPAGFVERCEVRAYRIVKNAKFKLKV